MPIKPTAPCAVLVRGEHLNSSVPGSIAECHAQTFCILKQTCHKGWEGSKHPASVWKLKHTGTVEGYKSPLLIPSHADLFSIQKLGFCALGVFVFVALKTNSTSGGAMHCCAPLKK